jgi:hypothetical protein
MRSGGSSEKKTRHLPTRRRSSPKAAFERFHIAASRRSINVPTRHRSSPGQFGRGVRNRALRQSGRLRGGSQSESPADFLQWHIVASFGASLIEFGRRLGVDDFLVAQLGKKGNRHFHFGVGKGVHKRLEAVAVGHALL